ncbi:MAG: hypothetical protein UT77_C0001G0300 [Candidatus Daviesbacteria bacterium GW2011_GWC2_40_12]|uniref:Uncharacterized protein n=1 Tax=Candidatus Daviesbacteria bacterium GW2011_GWC2_40_12 TaxID=1618431 RepID=A0A0G0QQY5_9BACT|nr:MAG: hypothetical protein UT77_C0001G0300 [Candidatus Daviesbacteria bacterium GW2011_GWC2_40_12]
MKAENNAIEIKEITSFKKLVPLIPNISKYSPATNSAQPDNL